MPESPFRTRQCSACSSRSSEGGPALALKVSGWDLYIASQIAQAHRGTLSVTSDVDQTVFTFVMPISVGTRQ